MIVNAGILPNSTDTFQAHVWTMKFSQNYL
jgi:hypothetical protein